jgi:lysyl-tRNA synthetase class 2
MIKACTRLLSTVNQPSKLPIKPYFAVSHSITQVLKAHKDRIDLPDSSTTLKFGGRIAGRRKASQGLIFLDLESNGTQLQVMLDQAQMPNHLDFSLLQATCQRGAILGIEGTPYRTQAGEFTILASEVSHLAECPKNMPMMNWAHKSTLKDGEKRFSQRHLDFIANSDHK